MEEETYHEQELEFNSPKTHMIELLATYHKTSMLKVSKE